MPLERSYISSELRSLVHEVVRGRSSLFPCRLAIQRVRLLGTKKSQVAKVTRREIAGLLEKGRVETAEIKCEAVMVRFGPSPSLAVGISLIYARLRLRIRWSSCWKCWSSIVNCSWRDLDCSKASGELVTGCSVS